jgi:hypothetical protein
MTRQHRHPLVVPGVYTGVFLIGITWCVLAIPPPIIGGIMTAIPFVPVAIGVYRGISARPSRGTQK